MTQRSQSAPTGPGSSGQASARPATVRLRTRGDTLRGLGALVALAVLVMGIPAVILVVGPTFSLTIPSWAKVTDALTRPDGGQLFISALVLVAWAAWAVFVFCVVVEGVAVVRQRPTPRLPLLAGPQRGAAGLVAAAAVLLTLSSPAGAGQPKASLPSQPLTSLPAVSAASVSMDVMPISRAIQRAGAGLAVDSPALNGHAASHAGGVSYAARADAPPTVTVHRGDTLWSIAAEQLGSGLRYREIAKLNYGHVQSDGRALTDAHWIYPGWTLQLPADAATASPGTGVTSSALRASTTTNGQYVVQPGDTLWAIAEQRLADGARYREIFDLNVGRPQHSLGQLTDPDTIVPGWDLHLPVISAPKQSTDPLRPPAGATAPAHQPPVVSPTEPPKPLPSSAPSMPTVPSSAARPAEPPPSAGAVDSGDLEATATGANHLVLGLTVFAAAGLVGELARRRRRQQRVRGPGQRIPLPEPELAAVERELRSAEDPITLANVRLSLRTMAANCLSTGTVLPRVLALRISPRSIDLILSDETGEAVAPFLAVEPTLWRLDTSTVNPAIDLSDEMDPYPALVTLGVADEFVLVVNLEAAGTLTVSGDPDDCDAVVRALAVELATSALSQGVVIVLPEGLRGLAGVSDVGRVQLETRPDSTATQMSVHSKSVARIVADAGAADLHEMRSMNSAPDAWTPEVFVTNEASIGAAPWSGVAAIVTGTAPASGWSLVLDPDGQARLEPLGLELDPQTLSAADYEALIALLSIADEPATTPLPEVPQVVDESPVDAPSPTADLNLEVDPLPEIRSRRDDAQLLADDRPAAPRLLLLGRVLVEGTLEDPANKRRGRAAEFVAYLALHPGSGAPELDEAIWPGRRVTKEVRNPFVSRVRHWLGTDKHGQPYLPLVGEHGDYRLRQDVGCDWTDFVQLTTRGLAQDPLGVDDLEAALALVRGRPFLGVDPTTYTWAEAIVQEMISNVIDVAHALSVHHLNSGDTRAAQEAAARGLLVEPTCELLHRDAIRAAASRGDTADVARLANRLRGQVESVDPDGSIDDETTDLLRRLDLGGRSHAHPAR